MIPQANFVTRLTIPARNLEAYRLIRPFVNNLRENGYDSYLLDTELLERNCYREMRNGYGTLQMLELTEPVVRVPSLAKKVAFKAPWQEIKKKHSFY